MKAIHHRHHESVGLGGAVFIVFLVLKLTGHVDWSWLWVTSPLWLPIAVMAALAAVAFGLVAPALWVADTISTWRRQRRAGLR